MNSIKTIIDLEEILDKYEKICQKWDKLDDYYLESISEIKDKYCIYWEDYDEDTAVFYFNVGNEKCYCAVDSSGYISDYDCPLSPGQSSGIPNRCKDSAKDVHDIFLNIETQMKDFCSELGFKFCWTDQTGALYPNLIFGSRLSFTAWAGGSPLRGMQLVGFFAVFPSSRNAVSRYVKVSGNAVSGVFRGVPLFAECS
jgi:hypothetical protein